MSQEDSSTSASSDQPSADLCEVSNSPTSIETTTITQAEITIDVAKASEVDDTIKANITEEQAKDNIREISANYSNDPDGTIKPNNPDEQTKDEIKDTLEKQSNINIENSVNNDGNDATQPCVINDDNDPTQPRRSSEITLSTTEKNEILTNDSRETFQATTSFHEQDDTTDANLEQPKCDISSTIHSATNDQTPLQTSLTTSSVPMPTDMKTYFDEEQEPAEKTCNFLKQFRSRSTVSGFKKFTASQFMEVWNHYDTDGNGYIEDHELDGFLREFVLSSVGDHENRPEILSEAAMSHFKETFMDAFDENQDGMIDISEIWRIYDKNCKGYIESKELKSFLKHILDNQKTTVTEEMLNEYTETILNLFDSNHDGKLQLAEMARLMPVKQNFLSKPILKGAGCITRRDIDKLFKIYDQNQNGTIEDEELSGLLKDLMDLGQKDYTLVDIDNMKKIIMDHWDQDHDGTISKSELRMFLVQQCKISAESQGIAYNDEDDSDDD